MRAPMLALLAELESEFGPGKLFRPYRDVRFSKDKTPYKTNAAVTVGDGHGAGRYLSLGADGLFVGGGYYHTAPDQVERLRRAVADDCGDRRWSGCWPAPGRRASSRTASG